MICLKAKVLLTLKDTPDCKKDGSIMLSDVLIPLRTHRGLERMILGSQATKVLTLSPVPVLIVK